MLFTWMNARLLGLLLFGYRMCSTANDCHEVCFQ